MKFDVVIVGGGITGAGLARDCALRGLKTLVLDKALPGRATTAASSHLIHGGLRYLLYDRLTTHTTAWDAGNIIRVAPDLVTRLPILWPVYKSHLHGIETVETLLEAYDGFQRMKGGLSHLRLGPSAVGELLPAIATGGLVGALSFDEWWVDAVGLVEKNLEAARRDGAELRTGTEVVELLRGPGGKVRGVRTRREDALEEIEADIVVNAAGPWVDRVAALAGVSIPLRLRKGTHLVYDKPLTPIGLLLEAVDGKRHIFVLPHAGGTLVGPTDLEHTGTPETLRSDEDECRYLVDSVRRYLPDFPENYSSTRVGARPILGQAVAEKLLSREYQVLNHAERDGVDGFVSIAGGKMSDFRLMAKDTVDEVCRKLGRGDDCASHRIRLDGQPVTSIPHFERPWRPLKKFLRHHPRLRELHALAYLGAGFGTHVLRRLAGGGAVSDAAAFREHYGA
ncbi:MAG: hypothetical protein AUJ52_06130 [Elusimicrobia bacterium CG1_02_63_36]|nr:MAG: hypothetical protein AUJ52_06130 [Elusimicrobia bacterium CG1_02_63_36]PIP84872.1 MAG: hypothetical protein COR54_01905 [Elusimicrobia bacterium CG22_combo_CG10-13_8_21_14_all_63_91]PJA11719.1 MAG: hypothetical protein COX66_19190 [Elusimicrobia bacterium CG_4_10_14_0_2_um_filter_63_34]PJB23271.1 MAG: hypothetical protein CO113_18770 [Elusimicrobia bacterium CG_4_9_14_3_um_filter_62_55]